MPHERILERTHHRRVPHDVAVGFRSRAEAGMKIGRRLQIAQLLNQGISYEEIKEQLKVGFTTINFVERSLRDHPDAYELINRREDKVEQEYKAGAYRRTGGSTLVFKRSEYTGLKRKDIHR